MAAPDQSANQRPPQSPSEKSSPQPKSTALQRLHLAARKLQHVAAQAARGTAVREDVDLVLAEIIRSQRELFGPRPRARRGEGGLPRILAYLEAHVGEEVSG